MNDALLIDRAHDDRRRYARFFFESPIDATLGGHPVRIADFGRTGAGLEHEVPFTTGREAVLDVNLAGVRVRVTARVVRCRLARRTAAGDLVYRSGVWFGREGSVAVLEALTSLVTLELNERRFQGGARTVGA